jgi:hypothetical protein
MGDFMTRIRAIHAIHASSAIPALLAAALVCTAGPVAAQDATSFAGKNVTVIVGSTPGGSTDVSARQIAASLGKNLPGNPTMVVQNKPGARGITAMNYFAAQVAPDGHTIIVGSGSQIDPANYRVGQAKYDPTRFRMVGGLSIGGSIIMIHNTALARLTDKTAKPVVMATIGGIPRSGMQMAAWGIDYLGWNARWVAGYRGNPDLMLAFERGEVEMTSFANAQMKPDLYDKAKYTILYQSGTQGASIPSPIKEQAGLPLFAEAMKGKIKDPVAQQAFDYWRHLSTIYNWVALPPKTPDSIVAVYRAGWDKVKADGGFFAQVRKVSPEATAVSADEMARTIQQLADVPNAALDFQKVMLTRQGLKPPKKKKKKKKAQN